MKWNTRLVVLGVLVLLVAPSVTYAQLSDMEDRTSVFRREFVGDPVQETLCHIPPGHPANAHTIDVEPQDVAAHLAHGDMLGECPYECDGVPSPVAKTGQWVSYTMGDDGTYQIGTSVDSRFTVNGGGTVTDNLTGLTWLQNASCFGQKTWLSAITEAYTLADGLCGLTDGSVTGDWRLPNVKELQSLIDFGNTTALPAGHPFSGVSSSRYWSSTTSASYSSGAWFVQFGSGSTSYYQKTQGNYVWPVKGGL